MSIVDGEDEGGFRPSGISTTFLLFWGFRIAVDGEDEGCFSFLGIFTIFTLSKGFSFGTFSCGCLDCTSFENVPPICVYLSYTFIN